MLETYGDKILSDDDKLSMSDREKREEARKDIRSIFAWGAATLIVAAGGSSLVYEKAQNAMEEQEHQEHQEQIVDFGSSEPSPEAIQSPPPSAVDQLNYDKLNPYEVTL